MRASGFTSARDVAHCFVQNRVIVVCFVRMGRFRVRQSKKGIEVAVHPDKDASSAGVRARKAGRRASLSLGRSCGTAS